MRLLTLFGIVAFSFSLVGCNRVIIRDTKAYKLEAMYFSKTIAETNKIVLHRLQSQCCSNELFNTTDNQCVEDGETYAVTHMRAQHHYERLMYLAGFIDKDPGSAPDFETGSILAEVCNGQ